MSLSQLQMTVFLPTAWLQSDETLSKEYLANSKFLIQRNYKIINIQYNFKSLNFGVICYAATGNWYTFVLHAQNATITTKTTTTKNVGVSRNQWAWELKDFQEMMSESLMSMEETILSLSGAAKES